MEYDPLINYTAGYFRTLAPRELQALFEEAKMTSYTSSRIKQIKKVLQDISTTRTILTGFDGIYNKKHD